MKIIDIIKISINSSENLSEEKRDECIKYINELQQENARLKDNWKKLEKFICQEQDRLLKATSHTYKDSFDKVKFVNSDIYEELKRVFDKMKELLKEN